jgi:flagellar biosynthesis GTPase FlhF
MAMKLDRCQRWLPIREYIHQEFGVNVNFSNRHCNYFTAWKYACKEDLAPLQSEDHPDLANALPPRTLAASQRVSQSSQHTDANVVDEPPRKRQRTRLSNFEFASIVRTKNLKTRTEVLAFASMQEKEGKCDLSEYIFNRSRKMLQEVMETAWDMENAEADLERSRLERITLLESAAAEECVRGCDQEWIKQAEDILIRNHIQKEEFTTTIYNVLKHGRGKYRNVLLIGPANCGKTFLLNPLSIIYRAFQNPASTTFAWVGVEEAEIIMLNDFRWSSQVNSFNDQIGPIVDR